MRFNAMILLMTIFCVYDCSAGEADELDEAEIHRAWRKLENAWEKMVHARRRGVVGPCIDADLIGVVDPKFVRQLSVEPFKHCGTVGTPLVTPEQRHAINFSVLNGLYVFLPRYGYRHDQFGCAVRHHAILFGTVDPQIVYQFLAWQKGTVFQRLREPFLAHQGKIRHAAEQ